MLHQTPGPNNYLAHAALQGTTETPASSRSIHAHIDAQCPVRSYARQPFSLFVPLQEQKRGSKGQRGSAIVWERRKSAQSSGPPLSTAPFQSFSRVTNVRPCFSSCCVGRGRPDTAGSSLGRWAGRSSHVPALTGVQTRSSHRSAFCLHPQREHC